MTIAMIILAGVAIFVLALLYYLFAAQKLADQAGFHDGSAAGAAPDEAGAQAHFALEARFGAGGDDSRTYRPTPISRKVQIGYARRIYVNKPFALDVHLLAGDAQSIEPDSAAEVTPAAEMQFMALEQKPPVKVSLAFAEGDFRLLSAAKECRLAAAHDQVSFLVVPCRAGTLPLGVHIHYLKPTMVPERLRQKTLTIKETSAGAKESAETLVFDPETTQRVPVEVYSTELAVTTANFLGLAETSVRFWQKAFAPLLVVLLLILGLFFGQLDAEKAVIMFIVGIADIAGVSIYPDLKKVLLG